MIDEDCISVELFPMKSCAVPGCTNTDNMSPNVNFFPFPLNANRCLQWLLMCNRKDLVSHMTETLNKNYSVCSVHFSANSFVKNHKKLLKVTSIPTLFLKDTSYSDVLSADCATSISVLLRENHFSGNSLDESFLISNENYNSEEVNITLAETNHVGLTICRLCSGSNSESHSMLNISDASEVLHQINTCLPINVTPTDDLPKNICFECQKQLENHFKFHQTVLDSDNVLKEMFQQICESSAPKTNFENMEKKICDDANLFVHNDHIYAEIVSNTNDEQKGRIITLITHNNGVNTSQNLIAQMDTIVDDISENVIIESTEQTADEISIANSDMIKSDVEINIVKDEESYQLVLENTAMYMCILCNGLAPDIESLYSHSILNHSTPNGNYMCVLCHSLTYFSKEQLLVHMNLHNFPVDLPLDNSSEQFVNTEPVVVENNSKCSFFCGFCNKRFKSKHRMEFHMKFHMGKEAGLCSICNKRFADENLLYRHIWYLHGGGRAKRALNSSKHSQKEKETWELMTKSSKEYNGSSCVECGEYFTRLSMRLMHEETAHGVRRHCHQCHHCMEAFSNTSQIKRHLFKEHGHIPTTEQELEEVFISCLYQCEYCSRLYTKITCLDNHRQVHHSKHPVFTCRYCHEEFNCHRDFLLHVAVKSEYPVSHNKDDYPDRPVARKLFCCQYCSKMFQSLGKMVAHISRHKSGSVSLECKMCGIAFSSTTEADTHKINSHPVPIREEDPARPHMCNYCPKAFPNEASLVKHIRTHTGERPYRCDFCGKCFSQSSGLITHTKTHTDERPYSCSICNQTFKIKTDFDNHTRKHSGARPFECKTCGKTFMTQHVYSQHCKIHSNYRPYVCYICGDAFRRSHVLNVHILRHSGEKPHACSLCDKNYRQRGDLVKHMRAQHGATTNKTNTKHH